MVSSRAATFLIILVIVASIMPLSVADSSVDHIYLLKLLDIVLDDAIHLNVSGYYVSVQVINAPFQGELGITHRQVYGLLLDYFSVIMAINTTRTLNDTYRSLLLRRVNNVEYNLMESVERYVDILIRGARDVAEALTLKGEVLSSLNTLLFNVLPSLKSRLVNTPSISIFKIRLSPKASYYRPGTEIKINVELHANYSGNLTGTLFITVWPSTIIVAKINMKNNLTRGLECSFTVPDLGFLLNRSGGDTFFIDRYGFVKLALDAEIYSGGHRLGTIMDYVNVRYDKPKVTLHAPQTAYLGGVMKFSIYSSGRYDVEILIDSISMVNSSLKPGLNRFSLNLSKTGELKPGIHDLVVDILATNNTIPYRFEKTFILERRIPRFKVLVTPVVYTWTGIVSLKLVSYEDKPINMKISALYFNDNIVLKDGGTETLDLPIGFLPIIPVDIKLNASVNGSAVLPVERSIHVVIVNPTATIILVFLVFLLAESILPHEKSLIVAIQFMVGGRGRRITSRKTRTVIVETPYKIRSIIASAYYGLLKKLHLGYPEPSETLREHLRRIKVPGKVKKLLSRIVELVERDLYSRNKPRKEEALKLVEEAMTVEV